MMAGKIDRQRRRRKRSRHRITATAPAGAVLPSGLCKSRRAVQAAATPGSACHDDCLLVHPDRRVAAVPLGHRRQGRGQRYDNRDPRGWQARQDNPRSHRANAAQLNAFEAFAPFAASVLMAQAAGVDPARIAQLAIAFVLLRVLHGVFYVAGIHALRSLVWGGGFGVVVWLMVQAALQFA